MTIRVNTLKGSREQLAGLLEAEGLKVRLGDLSPTSLHLETRTNLFSLDAFHQGWFEAQDEGSQVLCDLVAPPPKSTVVDFCAGAGGKTLALAAALQNRGRVLASDIHKRKLQEMRRRVRRAGATNVQAVTLNAEAGSALPPPYQKRLQSAERVLVDAPCSGLGALRRNPESRYRMSPSHLAQMPPLQRQILETAYELLAPGGRLVYATCTLFPEENQEVVEAFLQRTASAELEPVVEILGSPTLCDESGRYLDLRPDRHGCDGFFAAAIRRVA
jgi:16S rRNA (cytosine967-C5)-methyltransferase